MRSARDPGVVIVVVGCMLWLLHVLPNTTWYVRRWLPNDSWALARRWADRHVKRQVIAIMHDKAPDKSESIAVGEL